MNNKENILKILDVYGNSLTKEKKDFLLNLLESGEDLVALEFVCDWLSEMETKPLDTEVFNNIEALGKTLGLDKKRLDSLR